MHIYAENLRCLEIKRDSFQRLDSQEYEARPSLEHKNLLSWWSIQYRSSNTISVRDKTVSWVRIVNGVDKYVTESMLTTKEEDTASGKPIAEARPRQTRTPTLTSVHIPLLVRERIDFETQRSHYHKCYEVSKAITRLPRHDQSVPRGSDGAIHHSDIIEECRKKFDGASQWLLEDWISTLAQGGGAKKRFQCCVNPNSYSQFLYLRAIKGHSGDNAVDPALQDNVLLPKDLPCTSTTSGTRMNWIPW